VKLTKKWMAGVSAGVLGMLTAGSAAAETTAVTDNALDALTFTSSGVSFGDFNIDLRSVRIDHGTATLEVTSMFTFTRTDSWNTLNLSVDTTGDSVEDYLVSWAKGRGVTSVRDAAGTVRCTSIGTQETDGVNGTVTLTIPRSCLGSPAAVAVHVDVYWFGSDAYGGNFAFVDSAPGMFVDAPLKYSSPVASSNTGTATSPEGPVTAPAPAPTVGPVVRTKTAIKAKLSKKSQVLNGISAKLTIRVTGTNPPAGRIVIKDGKKKLKSINTVAGKKVVYRLPTALKIGQHRLKVKFAPTDAVLFTSAARSVSLRVTRPV
jgi:hypothetical protein